MAPCLEQIDRSQPYLQVLGDGRFIKCTGCARQFYLTVQRFVGDTQQCAVGYAQTETLSRDGSAFHVDRNGAR